MSRASPSGADDFRHSLHNQHLGKIFLQTKSRNQRVLVDRVGHRGACARPAGGASVLRRPCRRVPLACPRGPFGVAGVVVLSGRTVRSACQKESFGAAARLSSCGIEIIVVDCQGFTNQRPKFAILHPKCFADRKRGKMTKFYTVRSWKLGVRSCGRGGVMRLAIDYATYPFNFSQPPP